MFVSANVTLLSVRLKKPFEDATLKCIGTSPAENVTAWYRNSSDGKSLRLSQTEGSKYLISNDSLAVLKVGK